MIKRKKIILQEYYILMIEFLIKFITFKSIFQYTFILYFFLFFYILKNKYEFYIIKYTSLSIKINI